MRNKMSHLTCSSCAISLKDLGRAFAVGALRAQHHFVRCDKGRTVARRSTRSPVTPLRFRATHVTPLRLHCAKGGYRRKTV